MIDDDKKHKDQFDASLQLPGGDKTADSNPAAELIRKKVEAAYQNEPDTKDEIEEVEELSPKAKRSRHQQFIYNLTNSGRPLHEINAAWHEYYAGLTDREKHEVWQEFYNSHTQAAQHPALTHKEPKPEPARALTKKVSRTVKPKTTKVRNPSPKSAAKPVETYQHRVKPANPMRSLIFGLGVGGITILIFLFGFFNERFIAPFIQPSRNAVNIPIITTGTGSHITSLAPEIIIPKINVEVPVVYGVTSTDDSDVQKALEVGVVHYADTALPGQDGNLVIVGHSAGNIFNPGQYKYVFSLLRKLDDGDVFYLQKDSVRYTYQVYKKEVVKPTDVAVLAPDTSVPAEATLITCDPPGVSSNRLVVVGRQIDPDPGTNSQTASTSTTATTKTAILPSDSPTLWSRLIHWFEH